MARSKTIADKVNSSRLTYRITVATKVILSSPLCLIDAMTLIASLEPETGWLHAEKTNVRLLVYVDLPDHIQPRAFLAGAKIAAPSIWLTRIRPSVNREGMVRDALEQCRQDHEHTLILAWQTLPERWMQRAADLMRPGGMIYHDAEYGFAAPVATWPEDMNLHGRKAL